MKGCFSHTFRYISKGLGVTFFCFQFTEVKFYSLYHFVWFFYTLCEHFHLFLDFSELTNNFRDFIVDGIVFVIFAVIADVKEIFILFDQDVNVGLIETRAIRSHMHKFVAKEAGEFMLFQFLIAKVTKLWLSGWHFG